MTTGTETSPAKRFQHTARGLKDGHVGMRDGWCFPTQDAHLDAEMCSGWRGAAGKPVKLPAR